MNHRKLDEKNYCKNFFFAQKFECLYFFLVRKKKTIKWFEQVFLFVHLCLLIGMQYRQLQQLYVSQLVLELNDCRYDNGEHINFVNSNFASVH